MVGQVNNLLTRMTKVENILSELLNVDITALTLDEITNILGVMEGGVLGIGVNGSSSGGSTAELFKNTWAASMGSVILPSGGTSSNGSVSSQAASIYDTLGPFGICSTNVTLNSSAGLQSAAAAYMPQKGQFNGGFYFKGRFKVGSKGQVGPPYVADDDTHFRIFVGLARAGFVNDPLANNDDINHSLTFMPYFQLGFHYCPFPAPRGDTTWKVVTLAQPAAFGAVTQTVHDTAMPVDVSTWYDLSMRAEPGSGTIQWIAKDVNRSIETTGSIGYPVIWEDNSTPGSWSNNHLRNAGFAIWNNGTGSYSTHSMGFKYFFAQSLDMETEDK
jgi:hypothetical protein